MSALEMNRLEGAFYDYMHQLGQASPEWNCKILAFYAQTFAGCRRVLDVGCGEGQFLELLRNGGVEALGIDSDARMVEVCLGKGLDVVQADLFDYLPEQKEQFDGIFGSNLLEHLSAQEATRFVQASYGALSEGGTLLIATPNPASLIVQLYEFWRDLTHVRLYSRPLLEFMLHWAGFRQIESGEHPHTAWTLSPAMAELPGTLAEDTAEPAAIQPLPFVPEPAARHERSGPRRLLYTLRRRMAEFLSQNVLYEEFASLQHAQQLQQHALQVHQDALQNLHRALRSHQSALKSHRHALETLYTSLTEPQTQPREIYVRGIKPSARLAEET